MNEARGRLAGKVAVVTGAAARGPGIGNGSAVAHLYAREGASVVLVNRTEERGKALCQEITGEGGTASVVVADVSDEASVERLINETISRYGRLDVLHNNAASTKMATVEKLTLEDWQQQLDTNLTGPMLCCRHAIPIMRGQGGGTIINISTGAATLGMATGGKGLAAYSASKAGLHGLTLSIAGEHAVDGIRCNCIIIGTVHTPAIEALGLDEGARERRRLAVPLQTEGTGWDVAHAAVYLASDESRWVTGAFIPVDGGWSVIRAWG
jgi:NAD(P)-dependent dehydrogenase (short-subunit alcohol dehydrogenase family)